MFPHEVFTNDEQAAQPFANYKTMCKRTYFTNFKMYPDIASNSIWSPFTVFTETELGVICDVKPSVATVSIFMQLISAPESNKHENTYPPVSILNVVPLDLPVSIVYCHCSNSFSGV